MSSLGVSVFDTPLVFVDIETNGLNHIRGRVIEVGVVRVEQGQVVQTMTTLIDPEAELPQYITNLTGITTNDLKGAPTFDQIADDLQAILQDAIFVAHNVRFDYSFLKQEFGRLGISFLPKQLCTVKLSRALYPHERSHKLEALIQRHGFSYSKRHRAYDDAAVLWQFVKHVNKHFPREQIEAAIRLQLKSPAIPKHLQPELVRDLPETPGVYIFEDEAGRPLYVGKSINIKKRVMSHFGRDHAEQKEFKISQNIRNIRTQQTPGELSALLLESQLVKELQPLYNRQLRKLSKLTLVRQTVGSDGYTRVVIDETSQIETDNLESILAVYPRRGKAKDALNELAHINELCPKLMGLEKASGACFMYQLKKCHGACVGRESAEAYNQRVKTAFERQRIKAWPYKGAVLVEEGAATEVTNGIIVDQWCIVGEFSQQPYCEPVVKTNPKAFDLDTYKILQSFLASKLSNLKVNVLSDQQLQYLTS